MIIGGKLKLVGQLVQIVQELKCKKLNMAHKAVPGYDVKIIKSDQSLAKTNEMGDIVVKLPTPGHFLLCGMQTRDMKKIIRLTIKDTTKPMMLAT